MDKRGEIPPVGRDEASGAAAADVHELLHSAVNVCCLLAWFGMLPG